MMKKTLLDYQQIFIPHGYMELSMPPTEEGEVCGESCCLFSSENKMQFYLSYDVASGSEITPCNKIHKPLVVYRLTGKVMTSIITLRT